MGRKCFYSFHFKPDCFRAAQVRQIGSIEGNKPAHDNEWETVVGGGDDAIKRWIDGQIMGKSCAIILVGQHTAGRKWINHEIIRAWDQGLGIVGIHIHGLKDANSQLSPKGSNPFDCVTHGPTGRLLSSIVKCYDPSGGDSKERYGWISTHLSNAVEEAVRIRGSNQ